jgi:hypothetical protein
MQRRDLTQRRGDAEKRFNAEAQKGRGAENRSQIAQILTDSRQLDTDFQDSQDFRDLPF